MKLTFLWVGKTKNAHWDALEKDYLARLSHFAPTRTRVARDAIGERSSSARQRAHPVLKHIKPSAHLVLLDERGKMITSKDLATFIGQHQHSGKQELMFLAGGAAGIPTEVRDRADTILSLSPMTFPHEMARTILLEQIYRAFAILHNLPYPK